MSQEESSKSPSMEALEKRIQDLEIGSQYQVNKEVVHKVQQEFLVTLRDIRAAMVAEQASGGGSIDTKALEALRAENDELKKKNAKLEYRVKHVVSSMETLYAANKKLQASS